MFSASRCLLAGGSTRRAKTLAVAATVVGLFTVAPVGQAAAQPPRHRHHHHVTRKHRRVTRTHRRVTRKHHRVARAHIAQKLSVTLRTKPSSPTTSTSAAFGWTTSSAVTSAQCSLDGQSYSACASPASYSSLSASKHTFTVKVSNGSSSASASDSWTVTSPPPPPAPAGSEPACTMYASPSGSPSSAGASASSPTTFEQATYTVVPGSVVCLEPGTYDESSNVWLDHSGTPSAPITYRSDGGTALIQYTGASSLNGGLLETGNGTNWGGTHDVTIDGLTIDGANLTGSGIAVIQGSHHITISNCVIGYTGATGIALNAADYVTAKHNLIYHTGYSQGWSSGISLWYGGPSPVYGGPTAWYDTYTGFHNFIVDNIISGAYDNSSNHTDGNGIIVDGSGSIPPALIANNLVYENGGRGIEVYNNTGSVWVVNNTAYADGLDLRVAGGQAAEFAALQAGNTHFVNNLAFGRENGTTYTSAYTYLNGSSTITWSTNLAYNGTPSGLSSGVTADPSQYRFANPLFASPPPLPASSTPWASATPPWNIGSDFTLQSGSPALGSGTDPTTAPGMTSALAAGIQSYLSTDLAGNARSQYDLGAY